MNLFCQNFSIDALQLGWLSRWRWLIALLVVIVPGLFTSEAEASNGVNAVVPTTRTGTATFSPQTGLQIGVDTLWAGTRGYRPVKITASIAKPATADTLITIKFHAGGWRYGHQNISVEYDFELAQGLTSTTATFEIPQYTDWNTYGWEIWVDGVEDEKLCLPVAGYNSGNSGAVSAGILMAGLGKVRPTQLLNDVSSGSLEWQAIDGANLPDRWIDYTQLDVVTASVESLKFAQVSSPEKFSELLRWIRAGGSLWVQDVGRDFEKLQDLEKIFAAIPSHKSELDSKPLKSWHFLKFEDTGRARLNDLVTLTMEESEESTLSVREILESKFPSRAADSRQWFIARAYGMGTIVAIQVSGDRSRSETGDDGTPIAIQRSSLQENLQWATRHGNDPASGNPDFNNLLIPDVGTAPVFEFQLLISLFVIGIGPVNYWLLKRRNQLPVLLITVPLAAFVATLMLFTYGFFADGIGVRVRARSLTMLDQRVGEMASWARLSYYAGIAPSEGLVMPVDTAVYPILPSRSEYNAFGRQYINQLRSVEWDQEQRLTRGWLASRTPTQYLALTARPSKKRLQFGEGAEQLAVTNHLGTDVLALVVQDQQGKIFIGDQIDAEGTSKLASSSYVQAASKLRQLLSKNLPQLPAGYVGNRRARRGDYGTPLTDSLLELQLEAMISPVAKGWGNGTYLAVTAQGIEVSLGLEDVTESNSFHVLRGTW